MIQEGGVAGVKDQLAGLGGVSQQPQQPIVQHAQPVTATGQAPVQSLSSQPVSVPAPQ